MTAEPKMEDLLASIRKAIHEDIGDMPVTVAEPQHGDVFRGSMRELRVRVGNEVSAAAAEIQELRSRITRSREAPAPPQRGSIFEEGPPPVTDRSRLRRSPEPPAQTLRPSFAEAELASYVSTLRESSRRFSREAETVVPAPVPEYDEEATWGPVSAGHALTSGQTILSHDATTAAGTAFNRLADSLLGRAAGGRPVEDVTRELLRGMLKQWLDDNLPALVERLVREEIERVARRGR